MLQLEQILGKKPEEIPFYEDTKRMLNNLQIYTTFFDKKSTAVLFKEIASHYRAIASLDGVKEDMKKLADYLEQEAKRYETMED